ncbi:MAG TPA: aldehyde dehydrogenase [Candidatus Poseidoniaceae archaeon]|nr:aldehyde dehydrogenase [Candidatus Poseidoniaceae archaeon]
MINIQNYINGKFINSINNEVIENYNPATGEEIATIPRSSPKDIQNAVNACEKAKLSWSKLSISERSKWLDKIANELEKRFEDVSKLESIDTGKPISLARTVDATRSVSNFRFFANLAKNMKEKQFEMNDAMNNVINKPVGIAGLITPWNLPLYLLSWKVAPALVMGNCIIAKPSELTPMTANLLAEIIDDVGLPKGVFNLVHGYGNECGQAVVEHPEINLISFTGGTETGKIVAKTAAPMFKKISLELGGKNATIILKDTDIKSNIKNIAKSAFLNQGQVCLCGSRILVHESIYSSFLEELLKYVSTMKIGDPLNEDTQLGSLISCEHREKVESYIKLAIEEGGEVVLGGERPKLNEKFANGAFLEPTVIIGLNHNSRTATEEIFGPVVTIHKFNEIDDAINIANCTKYGLAASIWTQDTNLGESIAERLDTGMVWINCWLHRDLRVPFGGVKSSGLGREGGLYSLQFFSELQNICTMDNTN